MNVLVLLFRRYVLASNVAKSRKMTFQPDVLWSGMLEEAMALKFMGVGYLYQVIIQQQKPCRDCGFEITMGSIMAHHQCMQETEHVIDWIRLLVSHTVHQPQVYNMRFLRAKKRCPCPFPG